MSRSLLRSLALSSVALAACNAGSSGSGSSGDDPSCGPGFMAILSQDVSELSANLRDVAVIAVRVESTHPPLPETLVVRIAADRGLLRTAADARPDREVAAQVNPLTGMAQVQFLCATLSAAGVLDPAPDITARITAIIPAGGGVPSQVKAFGDVTVRCTRQEDRSDIELLAPVGEANDADRTAVVLRALDDDREAHLGLVTIRNGNPSDPSTGRFTTSATGEDTQALPITLQTTEDGIATFYVLYPGDGAVANGPVSYVLRASFRNALNAEVERELVVRYGRPPNDASIRFIDMTAAGGTPVFPPRQTLSPFEADLAAGSGSSDAVNITVQIWDRNGLPPPEGTLVSFHCSAQNNVGNCRAFTGLPVFMPDAGVQSGLTDALVPSIVAPATLQHGERGEATVTFDPSDMGTPDRLTITAHFNTPLGSIQTAQGGEAFINLVDRP